MKYTIIRYSRFLNWKLGNYSLYHYFLLKRGKTLFTLASCSNITEDASQGHHVLGHLRLCSLLAARGLGPCKYHPSKTIRSKFKYIYTALRIILGVASI